MILDPTAPMGSPEPSVPRVFLYEPGWKVALKVGSDREFCYMTAPGQNYYHRLLDGEVYLHRGTEEKLCLPCASRRGLLTFEPKTLREPVAELEFEAPATPPDDLPGLTDRPAD